MVVRENTGRRRVGSSPSSALQQPQEVVVRTATGVTRVTTPTNTTTARLSTEYEETPITSVTFVSADQPVVNPDPNFNNKVQKTIDNIIGFELAQLCLNDMDKKSLTNLAKYTACDIVNNFFLKEVVGNYFGVEVVYNPKSVQDAAICILTDLVLIGSLYKFVSNESLPDTLIKVVSGSAFDQIYRAANEFANLE